MPVAQIWFRGDSLEPYPWLVTSEEYLHVSAALHFFWMFVLLCSFTSVAFAGTLTTTYLYLNSQPGDWVGGGVTQTLTPADGPFTITNGSSTVNASFHTPDYSQFWYLDFGSPAALKFARGEYEGAQRTAFRSPTHAGIDVSGDGRGCNTVVGQFLVSDFALALDGTVSHLAIDFEQHCGEGTPALCGSFRYNSSVSQVPRLGVGSAYALKGNTGASDSLIAIALSIPSTQPVTVQYGTADGSAVQGPRLRIHQAV